MHLHAKFARLSTALHDCVIFPGVLSSVADEQVDAMREGVASSGDGYSCGTIRFIGGLPISCCRYGYGCGAIPRSDGDAVSSSVYVDGGSAVTRQDGEGSGGES